MNFLKNYLNIQQYSYHMVTVSPWPLIGSLAAFVLTTGGVMYMHFFENGLFVLEFGLFFVFIFLILFFGIFPNGILNVLYSPIIMYKHNDFFYFSFY